MRRSWHNGLEQLQNIWRTKFGFLGKYAHFRSCFHACEDHYIANKLEQ